MIFGDFHTHSKFSDGSGTIEENYAVAVTKGLKQLGCTEHGLRHIAFGTKRRNLPIERKIVDKLNEKNEIEVLLGIEANIFTSKGEIDLLPNDYQWFDFIVAAYHKTATNPSVLDYLKFNAKGLFRKEFTKKEIQVFTKSYVKAICSGKVDIISHLFYGMPMDTKQIAQAAADHGVFIELNGKKVSIPDEDINILAENKKVKFIINSDAHSPSRVGDFSVPMAVVERLGIDKNRITNWNQLVKFNRKK
ncbi:MAG TPA: PHP domain-containing protein [Clostridia bacterium]|nr:PHP domain-containing protein [Clostridia bacterium]